MFWTGSLEEYSVPPRSVEEASGVGEFLVNWVRGISSSSAPISSARSMIALFELPSRS